MHLLLVVASLLLLVTATLQLRVGSLEDVLVHSLEAPKRVRKRRVSPEETRREYQAFVENKLIQHSQALEDLLKMVSSTSIMTKRLLELCCKTRETASMPEVVCNWDIVNLSNDTATSLLESRRSNNNHAHIPVTSEVLNTEGPFETLGKKIPFYGNFVKNLAVKQFSSKSEPHVIIQPAYNPDNLKIGDDFHYHLP